MKVSWWNESQRHSLARKGIKTAKPRVTARGVADQTIVKHRLSNNIHKNITALDRVLRRATKLKSPGDIQRNLEEAERLYKSLATKIENHKSRYGEMPDWVKQDWVINENFKDGQGSIYKQIQRLKSAEPKNIKKEQDKLWNLIALSTEKKR